MKNALISGIAAVLVALLGVAGCSVKEEPSPQPAELVSISLRPAAPSIAPGTTVQLEAIGNYSNNTTVNLTNSVTWESSDSAVAAVSGTGLATAANINATGAATITATSGAVSGSTVLTVSPLGSLAVTPADQTIAGGTTQQYTALGTLQNGTTQDLTSFVTWTSSDTAIATISGTGLASAATVTGTTTITASLGTISGPATLTSAAVASIAVTPASASIALGTTRQFTATGTLTGGFTQDLTIFALWTSSTPSVATVGNAPGSFGLAESKGAGTTSILASFGSVTSAPPASLTVTPATLSSISVAPTTTSVAAGNKLQYTATGAFSDGTSQDLTAEAAWVSSNTQVATVSSTTGTRGLVSTLAQGTTTITAALSGVTSNRATLTVTAPVLVSITITPSNPVISLSLSVTQQFTAVGVISDGTTTNLTSSATWQSSNPSVALISDVGLSKGFANLGSTGQATITATSGTITGSTVLTVTF